MYSLGRFGHQRVVKVRTWAVFVYRINEWNFTAKGNVGGNLEFGANNIVE
jgi:hypothetical protein